MFPKNVAIIVMLTLAGMVTAADIESGPAPGEKIAALKVHAVIGPIEDKDIDYAAERKEKPTVYVFVQADKFDRPTARYLKELDKVVGVIGKETMVVAVWITGDADASKAYLPRMQQSIRLETTALTVSSDGNTGPNGWSLDDRAHVTTVVAKDGKAAARFAYQSLNETDVPKVEEALKTALGAKK
jgi:hypothetical protein